jgi:flagellar hook-associated protein 1 FlgK
MGGGLFSALNSARTSLEVNQKSLEVVGNNISNVNTPGYSRQSTTLSTYPAVNFGDFFVGQGVKVSDVRRDHDVFVTNQLRDKVVDFGLYNGQTQSLKELERIFNITEENIATDVDRFFDSWQELSASPSDLVLRDIVIQRGELLSTNFNNTTNSLLTVKENINDAIVSKVSALNSKIEELASLNQAIFNIEIRGQTANSARDKRDTLAKDLATSLGAESYESPNGMLSVNLPGGLPLVQGTQAMTIEAVSSGADVNLVLHAGGVTRAINGSHLGGEFKGLLDMRDNYIPKLQNDLDRLAYEISSQVNFQHAAGVGLDDSTGLNFFSGPAAVSTTPPPPLPADYANAARNMSVVLTDSNQVAAGISSPVAPGDNRNALTIANIGETYSIDGVDDFNSYYGKMTSSVGIRTNQNQLNLEGSQDAVIQLENMRDGLAGVSLEEEMIDLIIFQRGFESSAKFLSTIDEMMGVLIDIRR